VNSERLWEKVLGRACDLRVSALTSCTKNLLMGCFSWTSGSRLRTHNLLFCWSSSLSITPLWSSVSGLTSLDYRTGCYFAFSLLGPPLTVATTKPASNTSCSCPFRRWPPPAWRPSWLIYLLLTSWLWLGASLSSSGPCPSPSKEIQSRWGARSSSWF